MTNPTHKEATEYGTHLCGSCKATKTSYFAKCIAYVQGTARTRVSKVSYVCNDCLWEAHKETEAYHVNFMRETAKVGLEGGLEPARVAELTGLPLDEVVALKETL